jgi:hypothetical protein
VTPLHQWTPGTEYVLYQRQRWHVTENRNDLILSRTTRVRPRMRHGKLMNGYASTVTIIVPKPRRSADGTR